MISCRQLKEGLQKEQIVVLQTLVRNLHFGIGQDGVSQRRPLSVQSIAHLLATTRYAVTSLLSSKALELQQKPANQKFYS